MSFSYSESLGSERVKAILFGVMALAVLAPAAAAQVGHEPARSPYVDLDYKQEITPYAGWLRARHDPAGVAPRSALMLGVRYELSLTGPLALSGDFSRSMSKREGIDPTRPVATRFLGSRSAPVYAGDLALALNLTGRKSWHGIVPQLRAGIGGVGSGSEDSAAYAFGTRFAFSLGGGLKFVPAGGRLQLRADVTDRIFKLGYPDAYYRLASDNTALLPRTTASEFYTHHTALTVGVSYRFAR
jgi:hypothetical protein